MKKSERNSIEKWATTLTDKELENEYYDSAYGTLGSLTERMYDLGYDITDIIEQEEHEKFLCQKSDLLESLCVKRGIELWKK